MALDDSKQRFALGIVKRLRAKFDFELNSEVNAVIQILFCSDKN